MAKKFNIAINVSPLSDGNSVRGVGYFTKNLVSALQSETRINPSFKNFNITLSEAKSSSAGKIENFDLIHYPYFDPFSLTLPPRKNIPQIVSIFDLIPIQFKEHFPVGIRGQIKWQFQKHHLKQSDYLITTSHTSKYIIHQYTNYPQDKIFVIPGAADTSFRPINNQGQLKTIQQKYHLPQKFVLYVGDVNWNKNIPNLVRACIGLGYPLVIVGSAATKRVPVHPWTKDIHWLQSKALSLQRSNALILTGFVPDEDLPVIFNLATIYCQPSFAEGFGLPLVQAMQTGVPVAYSIESCLNEVMDYNGEFFNPSSVSEIKKALSKLWNNPHLRQQYRQQGLKRSKIYHWQYTAIQTLTLYRLALLHV